VDIWKVDIISLSLGFTADDEAMSEAIWKACASGTLVFAAAANDTKNENTPIRFPARMTEVICVFSSDAYGTPSKFNPFPRRDRPNFMFPGENIKGAWPAGIQADGTFIRKGATYKCEDGTSCATPIAAAVAAGILEFAGQEREHKIRQVKLLKRFGGMSAIFLKRMVDGYAIGENSFLYVKPWKLISTQRFKEEIPILISDTMDNVFS
jgi:subtilisin family serine protease